MPYREPGVYYCLDCGKVYCWKQSLQHHKHLEYGKAPPVHCPFCHHCTKWKADLKNHILYKHGIKFKFKDVMHKWCDFALKLLSCEIYVQNICFCNKGKALYWCNRGSCIFPFHVYVILPDQHLAYIPSCRTLEISCNLKPIWSWSHGLLQIYFDI